MTQQLDPKRHIIYYDVIGETVSIFRAGKLRFIRPASSKRAKGILQYAKDHGQINLGYTLDHYVMENDKEREND